MKKVYRLSELPEVLGVSRTLAYQIARSPGFPAVHLGRRVVVPIDLLNQWLASKAGAADA
jgi:predicted DNA-binding transcriptional regulator AlpA